MSPQYSVTSPWPVSEAPDRWVRATGWDAAYGNQIRQQVEWLVDRGVPDGRIRELVVEAASVPTSILEDAGPQYPRTVVRSAAAPASWAVRLRARHGSELRALEAATGWPVVHIANLITSDVVTVVGPMPTDEAFTDAARQTIDDIHALVTAGGDLTGLAPTTPTVRDDAA